MISKSIYLSTQKGVAANVQLLFESLQAWGLSTNTSTHYGQSGCGKLHAELVDIANECQKHNDTIPYEKINTEYIAREHLPEITVNVYLQLHDLQRSTFLEHAHGMYNAAVLLCEELHLDVIPVLEHTPHSLLTANIRKKYENIESKETTNYIEQNTQEVMYIDKKVMIEHSTFQPTYSAVALGGTFDRLHAGHKLLLTTAMLYATDKVLVGVSAEGLLARKKYAEMLQPFETRKRNTEEFLHKIRNDCDVEVFAISDVAGGMDCNTEATALVVSPETERSLDFINSARSSHRLPPLHKILIPFITTPDGKLINSTQLRERALALRQEKMEETVE